MNLQRGIVFLLIFCCFFVNLPWSLADSEEIKISSATIRPGDFLQVKVSAPANSMVTATLGACTKQLLLVNQVFIGMMPISYYTASQSYSLEVKIETDTACSIHKLPIEVTKRQFSEDRIKVAEQKVKTILTPANKNMDNKITGEAREKAQTEILPPLWEGGFSWPVQGRLSTDFGLIRYVNGKENGRHSGVDIAAPKGIPVTAANHGLVVFAGELYQTGLTVMVYHGLDLFTTYGHLSAIEVKEDDIVMKEQILGRIGATGLATGNHLHLTFRLGEVAVDPFLFLDNEVGWEF